MERRARLVDEPLEIARARDVAAHGQPADPLGLALEHVAPPREHRDVRSLGGERLGGREPHPGGGAEDDRRTAFETEVHVAPTLQRLGFSA